MSENMNSSKNKYPRSIFFPLLIIFVGVVILLSNLKLIPGDEWALLVRIWPIIFLFGAIDDLLNKKWVSAVFNGGIGTILILANFGFFPMTTWEIILNYWPVLLIALGLELIFKNQSIVGSLIGVGFSILFVLGLLWFILQGPFSKNAVSSPINFEAKNVEWVELRVEPIVSSLILSAGNVDDSLVSGDILLAPNEELQTVEKTESLTHKISISTSGAVFFPAGNINNGFPWELSLNPEPMYDLKIKQVIGEQNLDLKGLSFDELSSELVIGKMEVFLPEVDKLEAEFDCIIGEMVLIIPEGTPIRINVDKGISGVSLGKGFFSEGDVIYSEDARLPQYILDVNIPIGSLRVEYQ